MKMVITGITGLQNRGVEALVTSIIEETHKRAPQWMITVLTPTPDYDSQQIRASYVEFKASDFNVYLGRAARLRKLALSIIGKTFLPEPQTEAASIIKSASVVVASGGDVFSSDYGQMQRHLAPLILAQRHNVPVVFLAQSIGPFRAANEAESWKLVAQHSHLITVRESSSYDYVTKELGLSSERVKLTMDPAFVLSPSQDDPRKMLRSYGVVQNRPVIAVSVSQGISQFSGVSYDEHFDSWRRIISHLLEINEAQILLIPHVQTSSPGNDDRIIATNLMRSFNYHPDIHIAGGNLSASDFKSLISACDMVIAERMHAAIAGLSSAVCTVVIGYSVKAEGILKDLLGREESRAFLVGIHEFAKDASVIRKIQDAWEKRALTADCLRQVLPQAKASSESNFDLLVDAVK